MLKGSRLFTESELETIERSIRFGRIAGQEILWPNGAEWAKWDSAEREMWDRFALYKSLITYQWGYESKDTDNGSTHKIDATGLLGKRKKEVDDIARQLNDYYSKL